ncbi:MAG: preprotein translocase subunit SecA [Gammaproteobacteria bacterium]|jgi:preprotein translocase subunit SecA|nr:preprotein translocase subunit SecA [Gammaproteobacteria bacterium]HHZ72084.1 preprotein translocase subunit SecA [Gammaproteobacteria bacterium]
MFGKFATKIFGSRNQRNLKRMGRMVDLINSAEEQIAGLDDGELAAKTDEFRRRSGEGESPEDLMSEVFAVVRETARRTLDMRHFDVQLIGGMVLYEGKIAEMRTGEGKTLVATLPAYLTAVCGGTVHVVTVNDYLAARDADWMGKIYKFLGLTVGVIVSGQDPESKRSAYACDIVYGTNNEYGFDYLRDNMAFGIEDRVQRSLDFAIVDEVDSILVDEARTPLIISGSTEDSTDLYVKINQIIPRLVRQHEEEGPGDFSVDEKNKQVFLTEDGHESTETLLLEAGLLDEGSSLYDVGNISLVHHLYAALRAHSLFQRDVDYIVRDRQIVIIDEFTGRMMAGRRWGEGLHQAVEAKEGVPIQHENQTLAAITFQNLFRLYDKLSGMTGTADTEAVEFQQIYGLEVMVIPTNMLMIRDDQPDLVYRTQGEKFKAICSGIEHCRDKQQPVLVGTASIETSEYLSGILRQSGIDHEVLNAKHHEREARIIAQAGQPGAVTIATNMAGRGTDIVLGGNLEMELSDLDEGREADRASIREQWQQRHEQVVKAGGLHVLGTERNESRRVDNQLRGRCGRQGDPGSSRYYLSMEDNLMRIFGSERVSGLMEKMGMEEGEAIEHSWVTRAIENSQKKVEGRNFDTRKQLLEYDDVANEQRKVIYEQRNRLMEVDDISDTIGMARTEVVNELIDVHLPPESLEEQWDIPSLEKEVEARFGLAMPVGQWLAEDDALHEETLRQRIESEVISAYEQKAAGVGEEVIRHLEKAIMLRVLDEQWKDHLAQMDHLRQGIGLRGYAQKNPKQEYKREAFGMFTEVLDRVKNETIGILSKIQIQTSAEVEELEVQRRRQGVDGREYLHPSATAEPLPTPHPEHQPNALAPQSGQAAAVATQPFVRSGPKVGRNAPCPCGSGKKYKHCHGKL